MRKFIYIFFSIIAWMLYLGGSYIMWTDCDSIFLNYMITSTGFVGMLWYNFIFHEKFIVNKNIKKK